MEINGNPLQTQPSPSFYNRYKRSLWIGLWTLVILTAGLVTWVFFFRNTTNPDMYQGEVQVLVEAPKVSPSGSQVSYEVVIDNQSNAILTNLALEAFYPRGFVPLVEKESTFRFSDLPEGQQEKIVIIGTLSGSVQEVKVFNVKLHYKPSNFRSEFIAEGSTNTIVLAPEITLSLSAPAEIFSGQNISYQIELHNVADQDFFNLVVSVNLPEKFLPLDEQVSPEFEISKLGIGETKNIAVSGRLLEQVGKEVFVQAELFLAGDQGERVSAGRAYAFTQISAPPLVISHRLTFPRDEKFKPGADLVYEVRYNNTSQVGLHNVVLTLFFDTQIFDFSRIELGKGQFSAKGGSTSGGKTDTIFWTPAASRELSVVSPGQTGQFEFTIPLLERFSGASAKNPSAKTHIQFEATEIPEAISGNSLEFKIPSEITLSASTSLVSGDNPPVFGKPTTYRVELKVTNTVNDINDAILEAVIPRADTNFDQSSVLSADEQSDVSFNKTTGLLRWRLGKIFALTGDFHDPRTLSFTITVTPGVGETVYNLPLLQDIVVNGTDEFTKIEITSNKLELITAGN